MDSSHIGDRGAEFVLLYKQRGSSTAGDDPFRPLIDERIDDPNRLIL
jgi:hypothetical protein